MTKADTADQNSTENVVSLVHIPYLRDMLQYSLAVLILGLRPFQIGSFLAMDVAFTHLAPTENRLKFFDRTDPTNNCENTYIW